MRYERVVTRGSDRHRADLGPATGRVVARAVDVEGIAIGAIGLLDAVYIAVNNRLNDHRARSRVEISRRVDVGVVGEQVTGRRG